MGRILLDCGWNVEMKEASIAMLVETFQNGIDSIIISHPDILHIGALPLIIGELGFRGPIYSTNPVCKLGKIFLREILLIRLESGLSVPYSSELLDLAFDKISTVKYHQPKCVGNIKSKSDSRSIGCKIIGYKSGCGLGGTIWCICLNGEQIIYAPRY